MSKIAQFAESFLGVPKTGFPHKLLNWGFNFAEEGLQFLKEVKAFSYPDYVKLLSQTVRFLTVGTIFFASYH